MAKEVMGVVKEVMGVVKEVMGVVKRTKTSRCLQVSL